MFISSHGLALLATLVLPVSESLPNLNVEPGCRAVASMGNALNATLKTCMRDEDRARADLQKQWDQFSVAERERCAALTGQGAPSYVELRECLITSRQAKKIEQAK
jgi:hypothetical protein